MTSMKRISLIGSALRAEALPGPSARVLSLRSFRLALLAAMVLAMVLAGLAFWSTPSDGQEAAEPVWSADMTVVEYNSVSIGAASADLFSNVGGSGNLRITSLWSYRPGRDLRLAFVGGVPDAADYTLQAGGLSLEFPADSSGAHSFKWHDVDVDWEDGQVIHVRIVPTADSGAPQANTPATGVPTVSGTARVGETLAADTSSVADADGLTGVAYAYQWIRTDGGADADIADATESTHTLTGDDEGKAIKLRVTFDDDRGNSETLTSAATADVGESEQRPQFLVSNLGAGVGGASGIQRPLNVARSGFAQAFTTGTKTGGYAPGSVGIQVSHFFDESTVGDHLRVTINGVTINGVTGEGEPGDAHCTLTNPSSFPTPGVIAFEAPAGAGSCPQLAAGTTYFVVIEWVDPSGTDAFALIPQTYPSEESAATDEDPGGAEGWSIADKSYYLTVGSDARTWTSYDETASFKIKVNEGAAKANSPATGLPTITGTAQVEQTLTADTSAIEDADGLEDVSYSYQWSAGGSDIGGATAATYELSNSEVGQTIQVRVTFTDDANNEETLTSAATAAVGATAPGVVKHLNVSPHDAGALDLHWEAPGSDGGSPVTGYRVQWKEAADGWDAPEDVSEETVTGTSHTLTGLTGGVEYAVRVIATNDVGDGPASVAVAAEAPERETGIWSADLTVGAKAADTGYSYFAGLGSLSKTGFPVDDANYTVRLIVHSDDKLYFGLDKRMTAGFVLRVGAFEFASGDAPPVESDAAYLFGWDQPGLSWSEGDKVRVGLTLSEDTHRTEPDGNSPATGLPVIRGTARVGETLTADTSGIADPDGLDNASFGYQWVRHDGAADVDIPGETSSTYTPPDEDVGKTIKVRVSFADDAGNGESLTGEATEAVAAPAQSDIEPPELLSASIHAAPEAHDGETPFAFELRFSEEFELSYKTLKFHAFDVTGGEVLKAQRMDKSSNIRWLITVRPDSDADVTVVLAVTEDCGAEGAICTEDGRMLSNRLEIVVSGPELNRAQTPWVEYRSWGPVPEDPVPEDPAPVAADQEQGEQLWSATMTLGAAEGDYHIGYLARFAPTGYEFADPLGSISPSNRFSVEEVDYTVVLLSYFGRYSGLALIVGPAGPTGLPFDFTLTLGEATFLSSDVTGTSGSGFYAWSDVQMSWAAGDEVPVSLTEGAR